MIDSAMVIVKSIVMRISGLNAMSPLVIRPELFAD